MDNKQRELEITLERTPLGEKAVEYLNIKEELEKKKDELESAKADLVQEFIKAGLTLIKIEKTTVSYKRLENDKITVRQKDEKL